MPWAMGVEYFFVTVSFSDYLLAADPIHDRDDGGIRPYTVFHGIQSSGKRVVFDCNDYKISRGSRFTVLNRKGTALPR